MTKSKPVLNGFISSVAVVIYVFLVAGLMDTLTSFVQVENEILMGGGFLLLLVFSVAIVGTLLFGRPIYLIFNKKAKEAISQLVYNLGWLFVMTVIMFIVITTL